MRPLRILVLVVLHLLPLGWCTTMQAQTEIVQNTSGQHDSKLLANSTRLVCHFQNKHHSKVHFSSILVYGLDMSGVERYSVRGDSMIVDLRPGTYSLCAYTFHPSYITCVDSREYKVGEVTTLDFSVDLDSPINTTYVALTPNQWNSREIRRDSVDSNAIEVISHFVDSSLVGSNLSAYIEIEIANSAKSDSLIVYATNSDLKLSISQVFTEPPYKLVLPRGQTHIWIWRESSAMRGFFEVIDLDRRSRYTLKWKE